LELDLEFFNKGNTKMKYMIGFIILATLVGCSTSPRLSEAEVQFLIISEECDMNKYEIVCEQY
jgi:hypothetical protein